MIDLDEDRYGKVDLFGLNHKVVLGLDKCKKFGTAEDDIKQAFKEMTMVKALQEEVFDTPRGLKSIEEAENSPGCTGKYEKEILDKDTFVKQKAFESGDDLAEDFSEVEELGTPQYNSNEKFYKEARRR